MKRVSVTYTIIFGCEKPLYRAQTPPCVIIEPLSLQETGGQTRTQERRTEKWLKIGAYDDLGLVSWIPNFLLLFGLLDLDFYFFPFLRTENDQVSQ